MLLCGVGQHALVEKLAVEHASGEQGRVELQRLGVMHLRILDAIERAELSSEVAVGDGAVGTEFQELPEV
jgi:hypothetical protein